MVQKYLNTAQAAQALGVSEEEIKEMVSRHELRGFRDGADWKFKAEDIEQLVQQRREQPDAGTDDEGSDVLLSEVELGESDPGASGTVIGLEDVEKTSAESDIQLVADSDLSLEAEPEQPASEGTQFEELDLSLEDDLGLDDSEVPSAADTSAGGSDISLVADDLEDDDLVLGGGGTGSDINIGGDSGISLVDPADSGFSLEEPLELAGSSESLELGEDDAVAGGEEAQSEPLAELSADDDFLLTPLEETGDEQESESGSQVIALDTEEEAGQPAAATPDQEQGPSMAAMFDEDLDAEPTDDLAAGAPLEVAPMGAEALGAQPGGFAEGAAVGQPTTAVLPEAPYSVWNVLGLSLCVVLLALCGMFMFDLMRNMWSWDTPYSVNSSLMDVILNLIG